jgi:hypothetical protein
MTNSRVVGDTTFCALSSAATDSSLPFCPQFGLSIERRGSGARSESACDAWSPGQNGRQKSVDPHTDTRKARRWGWAKVKWEMSPTWQEVVDWPEVLPIVAASNIQGA